MVTAVFLTAARLEDPSRRLALFENIEGRFSAQARISVTLAGATGFYMTHRLGAWDRFLDIGYWWMHAMVFVWAVFMIVLFVAEPLFLHVWFRHHAKHAPEESVALVRRFHWLLLSVSLITIGGATLGAHGVFF